MITVISINTTQTLQQYVFPILRFDRIRFRTNNGFNRLQTSMYKDRIPNTISSIKILYITEGRSTSYW